MNRLWAPLFLFLLLCMPLAASAQSGLPLFDPEWQLVPDAHELDSSCPVGAPLGFGGVLQLVQNGMNATVSFGIIICVIVIAFAGILWILTPTNPENHSQAKKVLTNAAIGLLIILSAWLMVDFVMKLLYNQNLEGLGPWNTILSGGSACVTAGTTKPLFSGDIFTVTPGQGGATGGPSGGTGGGKCLMQSTGACAVSALGVFGTAAETASKVCYGESRGGASLPSGVDKLGDGTPYSFGLFQINITAHEINGLDCPSAFSKQSCTVSSCGAGSGVRVVKPALYNQCKAAAIIPANNIAVAYKIYLDAHARWSDWGAAKSCGLADSMQERSLAFGIIQP
jgi:hypothetical protein